MAEELRKGKVKRGKGKVKREKAGGKGRRVKGNGGIAGGAGKRKEKRFGPWYTVNKYP